VTVLAFLWASVIGGVKFATFIHTKNVRIKYHTYLIRSLIFYTPGPLGGGMGKRVVLRTLIGPNTL
jgi:hypothetical protein